MAYPTHLDALVADMTKGPALQVAARYGINPGEFDDQAILLGRITRARCDFFAGRLRAAGGLGREDMDVVRFCYETAIAAFALNGVDGTADRADLLALQPTAATVAALADAVPPSDESSLQLVSEKIIWLDLTKGDLLLEGYPDHHVAAMYSLPSAETSPLGGVPIMGFSFLHPKRRAVEPEWSVCWPVGDVSAATALMPPGMDKEVVFETASRLENFFRLVLLFSLTPEAQQAGELQRLDNRQRRQQERSNPIRKQRSFFRIRSLSAPADRFGRPEASYQGSGWTLNIRVPVRGHFRMQACGKGLRDRRLRWIAPHERGPSDARIRPSLDRLDW